MNEMQPVDDVIRQRRAKRGFLRKPVRQALLREILALAACAPSASNTQPWRCYVLSGKARQRVIAASVAAYRAAPEALMPEYPFFPETLPAPYAERFTQFRGELGAAQGVLRSDSVGRVHQIEQQFHFFNAPVGMIFTMDRRLEAASFVCYGAFLQNIMLAAKARGLDTCLQQIWSLQHAVLRSELNLDESEMVVAGLSLGWADNRLPVNRMPLPKMALEQFASFLRD